MNILCLHAHPDDSELFAGGTLAALAARGHSVTIVSMTAGDCGTTEYPPAEISRIRLAEAARSAAQIGAAYHSLGFGDLAIFDCDDARRRVTAALRRFRPELVFTASPRDYHCDHEATSKLVTDSCFGVSAPNYAADQPDGGAALSGIPHLYYVDPAEGTDRDGNPVHPTLVVDVASTIERKRQMLLSHESQRAWLRQQHGMDSFIGTMEAWTHWRGQLAGLEWGEGFRQYRGHAFPRTPLLEELLAGLTHAVAATAD
jgi:LmbE family N-acetylglucosaminyl deacetylase